MKKLGKVLALIVTVALLMSFFAACGKVTPADTATSEAAASTAATSAAAETTAKAPEITPGKVTFYTIGEWTGIDALKPSFKALTDKFAELYPGSTAEVISDPFMTWLDKYQIMFAAGNAPDVTLTGCAQLPALANAGFLLDVGSSLGEEYFADYVPGVLGMYTWAGKKYAVPFTMDTRVLYYNKDLFKQAGLDPEKPPKTWDEYLQYAKALTMDTNKDGKVDTYGNAYDLPIKEFTMSALYCASPGSMVNVDNSGKVTPNVNTPEFKGYLKLMADLKPYSPPDFATLDGQGDDKLYVNGLLGMRVNGSWILDQNVGLRDKPWFGQAMIPKMTADGPDGSYGAGFGLAIPASDKNPELALALLKLIMTPEFNSKLMTNPPPSKKNLDASDWAKDTIHSVEMQQFASTRQAIPGNLYLNALNVAECELVTKVIFGKLTVDAAVTEFEKQINGIVAKK
jgi:multiple sugar transport system substrate-binding protein